MIIDTLDSAWSGAQARLDPFVKRARQVAALTLPSIAPDELGPNGSLATYGQDLPSPVQSDGGEGVNNLASKMSVGLFPPTYPFFKFEADPAKMLRLFGAALDEEREGDVLLALARRERQVARRLDVMGLRPVSFTAALHLVTNGNCLIRFAEDGFMTLIPLGRYVVMRDDEGLPESIILRELVDRTEVLSRYPGRAVEIARVDRVTTGAKSDKIMVYTGADRVGSKGEWRNWQELSGGVVLWAREGMDEDDVPLLPLRFYPDDGEDYGRAYAEFQLSRLESFERLSQAMVEFGVAASKITPVIDPASMVRPSDYAKLENGQPIAGRADGIRHVTLEKSSDFQVTHLVWANLQNSLRKAFLSLTPIRDAERVTGEEIQATIRELNEALGGGFSVLSNEWQLPLVRKTVALMRRKSEIPPANQDIESLVSSARIVTGIDAIGRSRDQLALDNLVRDALSNFGPEAMDFLNPGQWFRRSAANYGVNPKGLVREDQEVEQMRQERQQAEIAAKIAPAGVKHVAELAQAQAGQ